MRISLIDAGPGNGYVARVVEPPQPPPAGGGSSPLPSGDHDAQTRQTPEAIRFVFVLDRSPSMGALFDMLLQRCVPDLIINRLGKPSDTPVHVITFDSETSVLTSTADGLRSHPAKARGRSTMMADVFAELDGVFQKDIPLDAPVVLVAVSDGLVHDRDGALEKAAHYVEHGSDALTRRSAPTCVALLRLVTSSGADPDTRALAALGVFNSTGPCNIVDCATHQQAFFAAGEPWVQENVTRKVTDALHNALVAGGGDDDDDGDGFLFFSSSVPSGGGGGYFYTLAAASSKMELRRLPSDANGVSSLRLPFTTSKKKETYFLVSIINNTSTAAKKNKSSSQQQKSVNEDDDHHDSSWWKRDIKFSVFVGGDDKGTTAQQLQQEEVVVTMEEKEQEQEYGVVDDDDDDQLERSIAPYLQFVAAQQRMLLVSSQKQGAARLVEWCKRLQAALDRRIANALQRRHPVVVASASSSSTAAGVGTSRTSAKDRIADLVFAARKRLVTDTLSDIITQDGSVNAQRLRQLNSAQLANFLRSDVVSKRTASRAAKTDGDSSFDFGKVCREGLKAIILLAQSSSSSGKQEHQQDEDDDSFSSCSYISLQSWGGSVFDAAQELLLQQKQTSGGSCGRAEEDLLALLSPADVLTVAGGLGLGINCERSDAPDPWNGFSVKRVFVNGNLLISESDLRAAESRGQQLTFPGYASAAPAAQQMINNNSGDDDDDESADSNSSSNRRSSSRPASSAAVPISTVNGVIPLRADVAAPTAADKEAHDAYQTSSLAELHASVTMRGIIARIKHDQLARDAAALERLVLQMFSPSSSSSSEAEKIALSALREQVQWHLSRVKDEPEFVDLMADLAHNDDIRPSFVGSKFVSCARKPRTLLFADPARYLLSATKTQTQQQPCGDDAADGEATTFLQRAKHLLSAMYGLDAYHNARHTFVAADTTQRDSALRAIFALDEVSVRKIAKFCPLEADAINSLVDFRAVSQRILTMFPAGVEGKTIAPSTDDYLAFVKFVVLSDTSSSQASQRQSQSPPPLPPPCDDFELEAMHLAATLHAIKCLHEQDRFRSPAPDLDNVASCVEYARHVAQKFLEGEYGSIFELERQRRADPALERKLLALVNATSINNFIASLPQIIVGQKESRVNLLEELLLDTFELEEEQKSNNARQSRKLDDVSADDDDDDDQKFDDPVPLRLDKLHVLLTGTHPSDFSVVFNNGVPRRGSWERFDRVFTLLENGVQYGPRWKKLKQANRWNNLSHIYRPSNLANRHGHSNVLPSFFALGYGSLEAMLRRAPPEQWERYKKEHWNCCFR